MNVSCSSSASLVYLPNQEESLTVDQKPTSKEATTEEPAGDKRPVESSPAESASAVPESDTKEISEADKLLTDKLEKLNKYFLEVHDIDIFTSFKDYSVRDVVELAIVDMLHTITSSFFVTQKTFTESMLRGCWAFIYCVQILNKVKGKESRLLTDVFILKNFQTELPFEVRFIEQLQFILTFVEKEEQNKFNKFINIILNFGNLDALHSSVSVYKVNVSLIEQPETVSKFLLNFLRYNIIVKTLLSIYFQARVKALVGVRTDIEAMVNSLKSLLLKNTSRETIAITVNIPIHLTEKDVSNRLLVKDPFSLAKKLLNFHLALERFLVEANDLSIPECDTVQTALKVVMNAYKTNSQEAMLSYQLNSYDSLQQQYESIAINGSPRKFSSFFKHMVLSARHAFVAYQSVSQHFHSRCLPLTKLFMQDTPEWREFIDFDTPDPSQMSIDELFPDTDKEMDEKVHAESSAQPVKSKKKKKKAKDKPPTTDQHKTHKTVMVSSSALVVVQPQGRPLPSISKFGYRLKSKVDRGANTPANTFPADLSGKRLSRSEKALACQSHALTLAALTTEMLQYAHCYDQTGNLNHIGKKLACFGALQFSLAGEQGVSAELFKKDSLVVLPHNQSTVATMFGKDSEHPYLKLLGKETLLYRFPEASDVDREEIVRSWPTWLSEVVQYLDSSESDAKDLWSTEKRKDPIVTNLTALQMERLSILERESQELWETTQKLYAQHLGEKKKALIIISKHIQHINAYIRAVTVFGHQAFLTVPIHGICLSAQTMLEYSRILSLANRGRMNAIAEARNDNTVHQIADHVTFGELSQNFSEAEQATLKKLHGKDAFTYLPKHCSEHADIGEWATLLSDLTCMALAAEGTERTHVPIGDKLRMKTTEEVDARKAACLDQTWVLLRTLFRYARELIGTPGIKK